MSRCAFALSTLVFQKFWERRHRCRGTITATLHWIEKDTDEGRDLSNGSAEAYMASATNAKKIPSDTFQLAQVSLSSFFWGIDWFDSWALGLDYPTCVSCMCLIIGEDHKSAIGIHSYLQCAFQCLVHSAFLESIMLVSSWKPAVKTRSTSCSKDSLYPASRSRATILWPVLSYPLQRTLQRNSIIA
jgi:hypothetical protein